MVSKDIPGSHGATVHSTSAEGFNSRELRNALGCFATGVTIITTRNRDGKLHGMTANSFTSVSLTPPLVLWSSSLYAQSFPAFQEGTHFVVNILAMTRSRCRTNSPSRATTNSSMSTTSSSRAARR